MRAPNFWSRPPGLLSKVLSPLAALYARLGQRRIAQTGWRCPVPVICVGNLTAGGTGKTPVAMALLTRLRAQGIVAAAVSRGYGGRLKGPVRVDPRQHGPEAVGDEPLLLACVGQAWIARDRAAGAAAAAAGGAGAIVMDDGFQNPSLIKDLSLVIVDGGAGFGNGCVIPAGPLREPVASGLARADAVVVIGADRHDVKAACRRHAPGLPVLAARLVPDDAVIARLAGQRLLAFAGIGRPQKFFDTLEAAGLDVVATRSFADHHPFSDADARTLQAQAATLGAVLVTTAKDRVRLPSPLREAVEVLPVHLLWEDPGAVDGLLARLFQQPPEQPQAGE